MLKAASSPGENFMFYYQFSLRKTHSRFLFSLLKPEMSLTRLKYRNNINFEARRTMCNYFAAEGYRWHCWRSFLSCWRSWHSAACPVISAAYLFPRTSRPFFFLLQSSCAGPMYFSFKYFLNFYNPSLLIDLPIDGIRCAVRRYFFIIFGLRRTSFP